MPHCPLYSVYVQGQCDFLCSPRPRGGPETVVRVSCLGPTVPAMARTLGPLRKGLVLSCLPSPPSGAGTPTPVQLPLARAFPLPSPRVPATPGLGAGGFL